MCATHHEINHHPSCLYLSRCPSLLPLPVGRLLTRLPRLAFAHLWLTLLSTTVCTCRREPCTTTEPNFSSRSPSCETHLLLIVCSVAVSLSSPAQSPLRLPPSMGTPLDGCTLMFPSCSRRPAGVFICFAFCACRAVETVVVSMSTRSREAQ